MQERRRNRRMELEANLTLNRLDMEEPQSVLIHITDVSKRGVGFLCTEKLKINDVYECELTLWTKEVMSVFLRIVRMEEGDPYAYGSIFIGMTEADASRIAAYQAVMENSAE